MKKTTDVVDSRESTANEFTNVKDIKGNFLYRKDGYVMAYLRIFPYNLDLLAKEEKRNKTQTLSASFDGDRKDFAYCAFPREIDLDEYKNYLKEMYRSEMQTIGKRKILEIMIQESIELSTSGENFEHQHFLKIWRKADNNLNDTRRELMNRLEEFKQRYDSIGVVSKIMDEGEIIKLCNLFGNSQQVSFETTEKNTVYSPIPQVRGVY